ncbi:MAG: hypothetical protein HQK96_20085, partial [Nitrospirae bacterium]|nr:hypothetical protein [Nitrospirota bacterium]
VCINGNCGECKICLWFGFTGKGGIISVSDAVVNAEPVVVNRVQLCEHSMQNIQLFSGEYLKGEKDKGDFAFDVIIDCSVNSYDWEGLKGELEVLLDEIEDKAKKAPPGWYRIGATSTSTGQVEITGYKRLPLDKSNE